MYECMSSQLWNTVIIIELKHALQKMTFVSKSYFMIAWDAYNTKVNYIG